MLLVQSEEDDRVLQRRREASEPLGVGVHVAQAYRPGQRRRVGQSAAVRAERDHPPAAVARVGAHRHQAALGEPVEQLPEGGRVHDEALAQRGEGDAVCSFGELAHDPEDRQLGAGDPVVALQRPVEPGDRLVEAGPRADGGERLGTHEDYYATHNISAGNTGRPRGQLCARCPLARPGTGTLRTVALAAAVAARREQALPTAAGPRRTQAPRGNCAQGARSARLGTDNLRTVARGGAKAGASGGCRARPRARGPGGRSWPAAARPAPSPPAATG